MSLNIGTRFGSLEITALLGRGGMGEVYRAHDTRLRRDVAVKILPDEFCREQDRVIRFRREAEILAALNHPNIAAIYNLEEAGGMSYLVLELVEGQTLSERLKRGGIPIEESLNIARSICEALAAAHEQGIVHRDLKPDNIKIRPDGVVKVLDFGLAKIGTSSAAIGSEDSPTLMSEQPTRPHVIVGTAGYMAPEQAVGATVDKRADIWAFGVVLYEMLTAKRLFQGHTVSETLAMVQSKEVDLNAAPVRVQPLLRHCLARDPKRRLRDVADAMLLLDTAPQTVGFKSRRPWAIVAAFILLSVLLGGLYYWRASRSTQELLRTVVRLDIDLGKDLAMDSVAGPEAVLSPDGSRVAFVSAGSDSKSHLSTRRLDQPKAAELANTEGAYGPFFSPDGQWLGFFAQGKLKKIPVEGGEPITLADAPSGRGASWGDDGNIVAALDTRAGLSLVSSTGGAVTPATEFDRERGEATHRWPQVLPGAKAVLFPASTVTNDFDAADIAVASLENHRTKIVLPHAGTNARFLASGHLVYFSKGTLYAVPFDLDRLEVRGVPVPVLDGISFDPLRGFAQFDISRNGLILSRKGRGTLLRTIRWVDGAGKTTPLRTQPANYQFPRISPDGNRLAVAVVEGGKSDIWVYDLQRDLSIRLTNGPGAKEFPIWTPDGRYVIFELESGATVGMYSVLADGASKPQRLIDSKYVQSPGAFMRDGTQLVFGELTSGMGADIRVLPVDYRSGQFKVGKPEVFLSTPSTNPYPNFSPDGRWIAYSSTESGVYEVYVRAFPDRGSKWQVSNSGGMMPVWSLNSHEILYRTEDQHLMVADYTVKGDSFISARPRTWSASPLANLGLTANFDLAPDGKHVAALLPAGDEEQPEAPNHVTLMLNFFDELRRRVFTGK
jgi:serine/threonine-protein kinase